MAKMRARRISGSRWVTRSGSRPSGIARASRSAMPSRRSAWASNVTPPSELIRPPSKAAVIFLRRTAGKQNGRRLSSVMAGVRASIPAKGWLQQPNPTPDQQLTLLPPPLIRPPHEYDRLALARREISRFPGKERTHMLGSTTAPGRAGARDDAPVHVAFRSKHSVGDPGVVFTRLNTQPMRTPVNASPSPSRGPTHDSGTVWFARPSLEETCTLYSLPVSRRTPCHGNGRGPKWGEGKPDFTPLRRQPATAPPLRLERPSASIGR